MRILYRKSQLVHAWCPISSIKAVDRATPRLHRCEVKLRILELRPGPLKTVQELLESGTVLSWGDEGGLFVAIPVDLKKVFGRKRSVVDFLAELKGNDGILVAVDDQNWGVDFL
jgi:hypothetical protein